MIGPNCLGSVQLPDRYDRTELSRFGSMGTEITRFGSTGTEFGSVQAERSVLFALSLPHYNLCYMPLPLFQK